MRLVCPRCGAQYEIDDAAIPAAGRDVECSACDHVWRATRPDGRFDPAARPTLSRPLSESVIEILREEAARELETRAAERQAARAAAAAAGRHAPAPGPQTPAAQPSAAAGASAIAAGSDGERPQTDDSGASLDSESAAPGEPTDTAMPTAQPAAPDPEPDPVPPRRVGIVPQPAIASAPPESSASIAPPAPPARERTLPASAVAARARRRHDAGYHVAVMIALVAVALYALAPRLADQGAVGARLMEWRAQVDAGRDWLDQRAGAAVRKLRGIAD